MYFKIFIAIGLFSLCLSQSFAEDLSKIVVKKLEEVKIGPHELDISTVGSDHVSISGWVSTEADRQVVLQVLKNMEGVDNIEDDLEVADKMILNDQDAVSGRMDEVKQEVEKYMQQAKPRGRYLFRYELDEEGVLISGSVPPNIEPEALLYSVGRHVSTPVRQQIVVRPWPKDSELLANVNEELAVKLGLNLVGVSFSVSEGIVTLKGSRPTHNEVDQLVAAVLMVEGVREIRSEMVYPPLN
jgi:osmotically-inducible protein OsmY